MTTTINLPTFKVIVLGDIGTGKTAFVRRAVDDTYRDGYGSATPNIGCDYLEHTITLDDGAVIPMHMWDTAGEERHDALSSSYYRHANAALFFYDADSLVSLESMMRWVRKTDKERDPIDVRILIGTKCDLVGSARTENVARGIAEELGLDGHIRCSSLSNDAIEDVMRTLGEKLRYKAVEHALADAEQRRTDPMRDIMYAARVTRRACEC